MGCGCERVDGMSGRVEDLMDGGLDRNTTPARGLLTYFTDDHNHLCVLLLILCYAALGVTLGCDYRTI